MRDAPDALGLDIVRGAEHRAEPDHPARGGEVVQPAGAEVVAGPLDRAALDDVEPRTPVRVQHRSGILWTLNSAGLAAVGLPDHPDGRLRSADSTWSNSLERREPRLAELSFELAQKNGVALAYPSVDVLRAAYDFSDLQSFLDIYYAGASVLLHQSDFEAMAMAYFRRAAADNAGPALASMLIYIVMAAVLFVRPQGLFPPRGR